ncbi:MAG: peptidase M48 [Nitrospirae bacterium GWD2_57_9]|nr:MAG: peptidase M48 [Nitrospirae bacterium GWD2_57_9]OGW45126.1 MAG: peptidase M48 [Nitrospirae bacterium GWC2_57_9]
MNSIFLIILAVYLLFAGVRYWLRYLNLSYLKAHGSTVPPEFQGAVDPVLLRRISEYTFENSRVSILESGVNDLILVVFLFGGLLGHYDRWIASWTGSFIPAGLLFSLVLLAAGKVIDTPFSLYHHFKIENRYGFNTMSFRLWLADLVKSTAISVLLGGIVVAAALAIVAASPAWWWLWVWAFFLVFGVFMMYISPYVIEPLFFKFEPVKSEGLEERIRGLMEKAGLRISRVFQVDASRRSRHSNAYFTGIGRVKRIVLFDTLIRQMTQDEILAVLAHEVGHWKKHHVLKRIVLAEATALAGLFVSFHLIQWEGLPALVGLQDGSFYARVMIVLFLSSLVTFPFTPLSSFFSRRHEREADRFAVELTGAADAMATALVKLSRENLSNLHPHPLYAAFYYSHPPVVERIRHLRQFGNAVTAESNS